MRAAANPRRPRPEAEVNEMDAGAWVRARVSWASGERVSWMSGSSVMDVGREERAGWDGRERVRSRGVSPALSDLSPSREELERDATAPSRSSPSGRELTLTTHPPTSPPLHRPISFHDGLFDSLNFRQDNARHFGSSSRSSVPSRVVGDRWVGGRVRARSGSIHPSS